MYEIIVSQHVWDVMIEAGLIQPDNKQYVVAQPLPRK